MQERLEQRLEFLKNEFLSGKKMLADLEEQQNNLRNTLLRISGAIQVLEELLAELKSENKETHFLETQPVLLQTENEKLIQS